MNKYYGLLSNTADLKLLEKEAQADGKHAIAFTKVGNAYIWNDEVKKPIIVNTIEEVASILEVDVETAKKIIESKGKYKVPIIEEQVPEAIEAPIDEDFDNHPVNESTEETGKANLVEELLTDVSKKLDRVIELLEANILE